jgi:segregation and condensation protein B
VRLSRAQLETLAIIAYRQPITRPEIDDIRGVDSSATLKLLIDRELIRILGKKEEVGRPMLYGTTKEFLDFFSLGDLRELPTLREYSELTDESRQVITDRLGPVDDDGEGGEGHGSPDGTPGGDPPAGDPGLEAAPATAADLIAAYVAELDAAAERVAPAPSGDDDLLGFAEGTVDDAAPFELESVDSGSLTDLDPFAVMAAGSGPLETESALVAELEAISDGADPSLLPADMAESADLPASSPEADSPQE